MKKTVITLLVILGMYPASAQQPDNTINKEKLSPFLSWVGRWQGEGSMMTPNGEPGKSMVDERIEAKLDNTVITMEGLGKSIDPVTKKETIVHQALGILSYDQLTSQYKLKTYVSNGRSTDAWFNVVSDNSYQWGFDTPGGKIRYNIQLDLTKNIWNETGEYSRDGNSWRKFFEMSLTKVD